VGASTIQVLEGESDRLMRDEPARDSKVQRPRSRDGPELLDVVPLRAAGSPSSENSGMRMLAKLVVREIDASDLTGGKEGVSVTAKEA